MRGPRRLSLFSLLHGRSKVSGRETAAGVPISQGSGMTVADLEQAYRDLMLENQVLAESNRRLHERLVENSRGGDGSRTTRDLVRAQRDALAERSHRLREVEFENKQLKRQHEKLSDENRRLSVSLTKHLQDIQPVLRREELSRRELAEAKERLREKTSELHKLTDKYYQLEARCKHAVTSVPADSAANSDF